MALPSENENMEFLTEPASVPKTLKEQKQDKINQLLIQTSHELTSNDSLLSESEGKAKEEKEELGDEDETLQETYDSYRGRIMEDIGKGVISFFSENPKIVSPKRVSDAMIDYTKVNVKNASSAIWKFLDKNNVNKRELAETSKIVSHVIRKDTNNFLKMLSNAKTVGTVGASNIYDFFIKAGDNIGSAISSAIGVQTVDEIMLNHEKVIFLIIQEYRIKRASPPSPGIIGKVFNLKTDSGEEPSDAELLTEIIDLNFDHLVDSDGNRLDEDNLNRTNLREEAEKTKLHLLIHLESAFQTFYFFKMSRSVIDYMNEIKVSKINQPMSRTNVIYLGRNNVDILKGQRINDRKLKVSNMSAFDTTQENRREQKIFLYLIMSQFDMNPESNEIDHSKYFGGPLTPKEFAENQGGPDSMLRFDANNDFHIWDGRWAFYTSDAIKTGSSIQKEYIPKMEYVKQHSIEQTNEIVQTVYRMLGDRELEKILEIVGDSPDTIRTRESVQEITKNTIDYITKEADERVDAATEFYNNLPEDVKMKNKEQKEEVEEQKGEVEEQKEEIEQQPSEDEEDFNDVAPELGSRTGSKRSIDEAEETDQSPPVLSKTSSKKQQFESTDKKGGKTNRRRHRYRLSRRSRRKNHRSSKDRTHRRKREKKHTRKRKSRRH
jgi:hypothetical protein